MPFARRPRETKLKREMTIRLPVEDYRRFLGFVSGAGLVYRETGEPRSAEAARVLLTSIALADQPLTVRVAAALYRNSNLLLYGLLAAIPNQIREAIGSAVVSSTGLRRVDRKAFVDAVVAPRRGTRKQAIGDVERLHLTLDGWLYDWTASWLERAGREQDAVPALRSLLVNEGLSDVHAETLVAYARVADRIRASLVSAVRSETAALSAAILKI